MKHTQGNRLCQCARVLFDIRRGKLDRFHPLYHQKRKWDCIHFAFRRYKITCFPLFKKYSGTENDCSNICITNTYLNRSWSTKVGPIHKLLFYKHYNIPVRRNIKLRILSWEICILKFYFVLGHWLIYILLTARTDRASVITEHNTWFGTGCYKIGTIRLLFVGFTCKKYQNVK